jgi:hypothetical protein
MSSSRVRKLVPFLAAFASLLLAACGADGDGAMGGDVGEGAAESPIDGPLGEPTAALAEDFGTIQTVRELPDGTLLIADPLGNALYHVDMDAGTRTVIGVEGEGPGEYRQPDAVWPLPGGSSLLIDLGNGRTTTIDPSLAFGQTRPIAMGEPGLENTLVLALPQGVDGQGRIYTRSTRTIGEELPDSGAILRIDPATTEVDTVAFFKLQDRIQTTSGGAGNRSVSIQSIPLSPEDAWGVASDGWVVVARSADYHVEWFGADGEVTRGPPVPVETVAIGTAAKEEYVAESGRTGGGVGISVTVNNGEMQMGFSRGTGGGRPREIDNYQWPETKPPFYSGRVDVDGMGRAWVRRHVAAGEDATYDVFGRDGVRVGTVTLSNDRRVIGFGDGTVYAVRYDEFDLNYLERYMLPGA